MSEKNKDDVTLNLLHTFERELVGNDDICIAGVDEAGRGPLAGPVVAAAVILKEWDGLLGVNDSKKITGIRRKKLFDYLTSNENVLIGVGVVSHEIIDEINILESTHVAMRQAIQKLPVEPDCLLIDGLALHQEKEEKEDSAALRKWELDNSWQTVLLSSKKRIPQKKIIKGDAKCLSIAAASIIAKETRDALMTVYDKQYPGYDFAKHKGYGTKAHIAAIKKQGPCAIHRKTFSPIAEMLSQLDLGI